MGGAGELYDYHFVLRLLSIPFQESEVKVLLDLILRALESELIVERFLKDKFCIGNRIPLFKVVNCQALLADRGYFGLIVFYTFCFLKPLIACFSFLLQKGEGEFVRPVMIVTGHLSAPLRVRVETHFSETFEFVQRRDLPKFYSSRLGPLDRLAFVSTVLIAYVAVMGCRLKGRSFSIFSLFDLMEICVVLRLIERANERGFPIGSDDHIQRYSFLLSSFAEKSFILQHGYVDSPPELVFEKIDVLFCYDRSFVKNFRDYIRDIREVFFLTNTLEFSKCRFSTDKPILLLASSYPYIDQELEFLNTQSVLLSDFHVVVKLHPFHVYDNRVRGLEMLCETICGKEDNPICDLMVSYNSFLNFHYKASKVLTFSIQDSGLDSFKDKVKELYCA